MEAIRNQLAALGVAVEKMDDDTIRAVAKAMKLELPRQVKLVDYKGAKYIQTENFVVPGKDASKPGTARSLFLRVEAVEQAMADLTAAKGLLGK